MAKKKNAKDGISKKKCIDVLQALQAQNPEKNITRNFFRANTDVKDSEWEKHFGTFPEFKKAAGVELSRHQKKIKNDVAKHASVDHYKQFYKEKVLPWNEKYPKQRRLQSEK